MAYILALSLGPLHSDSLRVSLIRLNGAERTSRRGKQEQEVAEVHRRQVLRKYVTKSYLFHRRAPRALNRSEPEPH
jgi:hypothetical protein